MAQNYQLQKTGQEIDDLLQKIDDLGPASSGSAGTMSAEDKAKLDDIETGAETNVIEGIVLGETSLTPSASKTITIPVDSEPAEGSENLVASGGVYGALDGKMDKDTSAGENDIAVFNDEGQVVGSFDVNEVVREGRIKQTTGQSTTDLMSQKAVTDALDTKAAKDEDAVDGNLAKFDANGNPVDAGIAAEKVAQKGEIQTYSGNLVDTRSAGTAQEFTYRKSGGDGVNWMRRIKGKSLVWNQIVDVDAIPDSSGADTTLTVVNHKIRINGTASVTYDYTIPSVKEPFVAGHTYLLRHRGESDIKVAVAANGNYPAFTANGDKLLTVSTVGSHSLFIEVTSGVVYNNADCYISIFDLTLMFGAGNEPSTVEEFEKLYPLSYYAYNAGTIVNNAATGLESVGFNQWDEELEVGKYGANGVKQTDATRMRCKNPVPVFGGAQYYACGPISVSADFNYIWLDADGNSIEGQIQFITSQGLLRIAPNNARYVVFYMGTNYGTTYNHDICINLSDASRNGTYEPYWKKSIQLGLNSFRVTDGTNIITVNGLKSAGSVFDEIDPVRKKYIRRLGEVNLGDLTWTYSSSSFLAALQDASNGNVCVCAKYPYSAATQSLGQKDKTCRISVDGTKNVIIKDSNYSDTAAFKTAMSGVMLYYELAIPVEYDLVDDIPNAIEVDENGTERAIFPEAVDPSAPFAADSNYSVSTANLVRKLNDAS